MDEINNHPSAYQMAEFIAAAENLDVALEGETLPDFWRHELRKAIRLVEARMKECQE